MKDLSIDLETYSGTDLNRSGVYPYTEDPDFAVLLFGYSADGGPVQVVDLARGEELPAEIREALTDDGVIKWAYNASFERICLSRYLGLPAGRYLNPAAWRCTMTWAAYLGLPFSLADVGAVMGLDKQKLTEGRELITRFCSPCAPTLYNGNRTRNLPRDDPEAWKRFVAYNKRDVETEQEIRQRLAKYPVPESVWAEYTLSEEINDRGIRVDMPLVERAIALDTATRAELTEQLQALTGLSNPGSVSQMKGWLAEQGLETADLSRKKVAALAAVKEGTDIGEAMELRLQLAKASVRKYDAMEAAACSDSRCRGMFRFYGASRSGRFSGKLVQLQNLPQNHLAHLEEVRTLLREGSFEEIRSRTESIPDLLSQLIRTAFVPSRGKKFIIADYSAIECRVLSWLAGEQWVLDAFTRGEDIYCSVASRMYHCPVVKNGENGELRQKGKQATLSCGYGGGVNALRRMGALDSGMKEEELQPLVDAWRAASPNVVRFWYAVEQAAKAAVRLRTVKEYNGIRFIGENGILFLQLPSGRVLSYLRPALERNRFGKEGLTYDGTDESKKWGRVETFGGKLTENIVQAVARDLLLYALGNLRKYDVVAHVHDEVILEAHPEVPVETVCDIMGTVPPWAPGLILRADGFESPFYRKE